MERRGGYFKFFFLSIMVGFLSVCAFFSTASALNCSYEKEGSGEVSFNPFAMFVLDGKKYVVQLNDSLSRVTISEIRDLYGEEKCSDCSGIEDVFVKGNLIYVLYNNELVIVDIGNLSFPKILGKVEFSGLKDVLHNVYVDDKYAYVAAEEGGLKVVDISNLSSPKLVKEIDVNDWVVGVCKKGSFLFITNGWGNLIVLDISDLNHPTVVANVSIAEDSSGMDLEGNTLLVAVQNGNVQEIDISDPYSPKPVKQFHSSIEGVQEVRIYGNVVVFLGNFPRPEVSLFSYTCSSNKYVVDKWFLVSLPVKRSIMVDELGNFTVLWKYVAKENKWAAWSPYESVMEVIKKYADFGTYGIANEVRWGEGFWVLSDSNCAFELNGEVYNIEDLKFEPGWNLAGTGETFSVDKLLSRGEVEIVWKYKDGKWYAWSPIKEIQDVISYYASAGFLGGVIDTINKGEGFWIKFSSDQSDSNLLASLSINCNGGEVSGTGEGYYAVFLDFMKSYVGETYERSCFIENTGEKVINIGSLEIKGKDKELSVDSSCNQLKPGESCEIKMFFTPVESGYREKSYDLLLNGSRLAQVIIHVKSILRPVSSVLIGGLPQGIEVRKGYAYVAAFSSGLKIFDVSDPKKPKLVSDVALPGVATDVDVLENRAYVSLGSEGLAVIDVSNPASPRVISLTETGNEYWDVEVAKSIGRGVICLADPGSGVVDIFDMDTMRKVYRIEVGATRNKEPIKVAARITDLNASGYPKGLVIVVAAKDRGLKVFYAKLFKGWGELKEIYSNENIDAVDVVPANDDLFNYKFFVSTPDKIYLLQTSLIFLGSQPEVSLVEISRTVLTEDGYEKVSIPGSFTGVDENSWKVVTGDYKFCIVKPELIDAEYASGYLEEIDTESFGSVDIEGNCIYVANKNRKSLDIFCLSG